MQLNAPESSAVLLGAGIHRSSTDELLLDYTIDVHSLSLVDGVNCEKKVKIIVGVVAWKGSGEPQRKFTVVNQDLSPAQLQSVLADGLHARQSLPLGPGPAVVKVGTMDLATGVFGTLDIVYNGSAATSQDTSKR